MDDVLRPVDLDRRPVALHGGDFAAGDAPQQTGAVQVVQRARWMTSEQGQRIPAEVGGTLSPAAAAMYELGRSHSEKRPTDAAALRHALVGDANARRPAPNPAGCPAWARSRQNAAGLVGRLRTVCWKNSERGNGRLLALRRAPRAEIELP